MLLSVINSRSGCAYASSNGDAGVVGDHSQYHTNHECSLRTEVTSTRSDAFNRTSFLVTSLTSTCKHIYQLIQQQIHSATQSLERSSCA